jgi:hypothetical protein
MRRIFETIYRSGGGLSQRKFKDTTDAYVTVRLPDIEKMPSISMGVKIVNDGGSLKETLGVGSKDAQIICVQSEKNAGRIFSTMRSSSVLFRKSGCVQYMFFNSTNYYIAQN